MLLQVEKRQVEPDVTVLELKGRITLGRESQRLEDLVKELRSQGVAKVVMDLAGVDYIDSSGLGILTFCLATMKNAGGGLRVASPTARVSYLLQFTQLDKILPIDEDAAAACRNFASAAQAGA